jgi:hypothetical protein
VSPVERQVARELVVLRCELRHGRRRRAGRLRVAMAARLRAIPARGRWAR